MKFRIVYLIIGVVLGWLLAEKLLPAVGLSSPEVITKTETITKDSIVYETKDSIIYETDTLFYPKLVYKKPSTQDQANEHGVDSVSMYQDSVRLDSGLNLAYSAQVLGVLDWINFSYIDTRPEKVRYITKEITTEKTITQSDDKAFKGFYLTAGYTTDNTVQVGAQVHHKRRIYGYEYTPLEAGQRHSFKIGIKVF